MESLEVRVRRLHREQWGVVPEVIARAPGRINLLGGHTDYNEGFVLPVAIDRYIAVAVTARRDQTVAAHAADLGRTVRFRLDDRSPDPSEPWSNYVRGVTALIHARVPLRHGFYLTVSGNVPIGAGVSSSAALEVATALALVRLYRIQLTDLEIIQLCQQAEHEFAGVRCGIMDQFVSTLARAGHALFLDCRDLSYEYVPLPEHVAIVVGYTGIRRTLAGSEYNLRRQQCQQAVAALRQWTDRPLRSLRDVSGELLDRVADRLDPVLLRRARHVVTENERVRQGARALWESNMEQFGTLMVASHRSLRDDYEVSAPELDTMMDLAMRAPGFIGGRMTGAGFGGAVVCIVEAVHADAFVAHVRPRYESQTGRQSLFLVCRSSDGAKYERYPGNLQSPRSRGMVRGGRR